MVDKDFLREMSKSRKDVVDEGDHKYRPLALVLAVLYRCNRDILAKNQEKVRHNQPQGCNLERRE